MSSSVQFTIPTDRRTTREIQASTPKLNFVISRSNPFTPRNHKEISRPQAQAVCRRQIACARVFDRDDRRQRCQYQRIIAIQRTATTLAAVAAPIGSIWIRPRCPSTIGFRRFAGRCAATSSVAMFGSLRRRHFSARSTCGRPAQCALHTSQQLPSILFATQPSSIRKMTASLSSSWSVERFTSRRKAGGFGRRRRKRHSRLQKSKPPSDH